MQVLPRVGSDAGDGQTVFDVEYKFNRVISKASINEDQKSVTFEIIGRPVSNDNDLTLNLPKNLIDEPFIVWVNGQQITNFELEEEGGLNILTLPLTEQSELVTIVGASIVPEFGPIAWMILGIAVLSMVVITSKTQKFGIPKF
jgi:predicted secreted protein with PEFG-CTERM motif